MTLEFDGENSSPARAFPSLESLELQECPMLTGNFPKCIPVLKRLKIVGCPKLINSPVSLPSLEELCIEECIEAVLRSMVDLNSLKTLRISKVFKLIWLPKSFVKSLTALEDIEIRECDQLTCLWEEGANLFSLTCLKRMSIKKCPTLRMFPRGKLPTTLKILQIQECEKLESLPAGIMINGDACEVSHLEELGIFKCSCLESFPSGHLPNSFKQLIVDGCKQLEFIPQRMLQFCTELEHISIDGGHINSGEIFWPFYKHPSLVVRNFAGLESLCLFSPSLKSLTIQNCKNLKSLPEKLQDLNSLDELCIGNCPEIESIPDDGLPPNLTKLRIYECSGIQSIPDGGLLPNLTSLQICICSGIQSIPDDGLLPNLTTLKIDECSGIESIPDSGFPRNLGYLEIGCENLKKPMHEWGLSNLTSLLTFRIKWICPSDNVLPTSLTSLDVRYVENMKSIPRGLLQNLNSLKHLRIWRWPKLLTLPEEPLPASLQELGIYVCDNFQSLPNKVLPPSLQVLGIEGCDNFESLPEGGLPPSLERLCIRGCPLLQRRCIEEKGDYWPLIAHIPRIELKYEDFLDD